MPQPEPQSGQRSSGWQLPLKAALLTAGLLLTNHFVGSRLAYFLHSELYFELLVFFGIWALALAALLVIAFLPFSGLRLAWTIPVALGTFAGELYYRIVGVRLTVDAIDAMWDPDMFNVETLAAYGDQALAAAAGTTLLVAGLLCRSPRRLPPRRWLALLPLLPCLLAGALVMYVGAGDGRQTLGMPAAFHNLGLFAVYTLDPRPVWAHAEVAVPRTTEPAASRIVLVVDESVSGDFIDLNVPRGTTPFLATSPAGVVNFGLATAASNCSNASNAVLRMGISPEQLDGAKELFLTNPTIWKYAREAGYETTYIQAKDYVGTLQNFMHREEIALIDHILTVPAGTPVISRDAGVLQLLLETLQRPGRQFVYVNKQGAHFPYQRYAPQAGQRFQPTLGPLDRIGDRPRLVNTYMNAIHHAVDSFFEGFLARADLSDAAIIYTSDHGQNLLDDGSPVTHCRRHGHNFYEVVVPLLAWAGDESLRQRLQQAAGRNAGAASHFEVFPTVLTLFGYDPASVRERYTQDLFAPIEHPMGYVAGPISGRFGRKPAWNGREAWDTLQR